MRDHSFSFYERQTARRFSSLYRGDILTNKVVKLDYTSKKTVRNNGQREQAYIEEHHEPIVDPTVFDEVQRYIDSDLLNGLCTVQRQTWFAEHPELLERRQADAAGRLDVQAEKKR